MNHRLRPPPKRVWVLIDRDGYVRRVFTTRKDAQDWLSNWGDRVLGYYLVERKGKSR